MDKLATQLSEVIDKLKDPGLDAARAAVRMNAITTMATCALGLIVGVLSGILCAYMLRKRPRIMDDDQIWGLIAMFSGMVSLLCLGAAAAGLVDAKLYYAFTYPDVVLAAKILQL